MAQLERTYLPAAGRHWSLPLYDPMVKLREQAAQAQREQAAKEVGQSVREVFRKLVSALHPDREPDATERQRKNELMQRVNRAYETNDLLTLLSLQLEIEQIDAAHLSSLTSQRLAHYNEVLREQLAKLEAGVAHFAQPFRMAMGGTWNDRATPTDVDRQLSADIAEAQIAVRQLQEDLVAFRDPERLRGRLAEVEFEESDDPLGAMEGLAGIFGSFQVAPRPRRRSRR